MSFTLVRIAMLMGVTWSRTSLTLEWPSTVVSSDSDEVSSTDAEYSNGLVSNSSTNINEEGVRMLENMAPEIKYSELMIMIQDQSDSSLSWQSSLHEW